MQFFFIGLSLIQWKLKWRRILYNLFVRLFIEKWPKYFPPEKYFNDTTCVHFSASQQLTGDLNYCSSLRHTIFGFCAHNSCHFICGICRYFGCCCLVSVLFNCVSRWHMLIGSGYFRLFIYDRLLVYILQVEVRLIDRKTRAFNEKEIHFFLHWTSNKNQYQ